MFNFWMGLGFIIIFLSPVWFVVDLIRKMLNKPSKLRYSIMAFVAGWLIAICGSVNDFSFFIFVLVIGLLLEWGIYKVANKKKPVATNKDASNGPDIKPVEAIKPSKNEQIKTPIAPADSFKKEPTANVGATSAVPASPIDNLNNIIANLSPEEYEKEYPYYEKIMDCELKISDLELKISEAELKQPDIQDDSDKYEAYEDKIDSYSDRIDIYNEKIDVYNEKIDQIDKQLSKTNSANDITDEIVPGIVLKTRLIKHNPKSGSHSKPKYQQFLTQNGVEVEDISNNKINDFVIFDLETTGLSYEDDEIIQISALKVKNDQIADQFNSYVKPKSGIPERITKITGITNNDVANADSIAEVMPKFNKFTEAATLIGHNIIPFDIPFLVNNGFTQKYIKAIDTLRMVKRMRNEFPVALKNMKLATLKEYFGLENKSHDALEDCKTNLVVYRKLRDHDLDHKVAISKDPDSELKGLTFVLTGTFDKTKKEIKAEIEAHGGRVTGSVSGKTDYLIDGEQTAKILTDGKHSASELKAHELQEAKGKIQIIAYPQLKQLIIDRKSTC